MLRRRPVHNSAANRLTVLGLLAAPILALAAGVAGNSSGPSIAVADDPLQQKEPDTLRAIPERELPLPIAERSAELADGPLPNPLYYPERQAAPTVDPPPQTEPKNSEPAEALRLPAPCVVSAVMRGRDGTMRVVIDGALYAAGEELAPGWIVETIDPDQRTVILRQPDGKSRRLGMNAD